MSYNPLTSQVAEATKNVADLTKDRRQLATEIEWHARFDARGAARTRAAASRRVNTLEPELASAKVRAEQLALSVSRLAQEASLGLNPLRWFSDERSRAKIRQHSHEKELQAAATAQKQLQRELTQSRTEATKAANQLARFGKFDSATATAELAHLDARISMVALDLEILTSRMNNLDRQLAEPAAQLRSAQAERDSVYSDLREAERLDNRLDRAANGYERHLIHEEAASRLGNSSPRAVISRGRGKVRRLDSDIAKLERRIAGIAERGSRDVRAIVVDGNNVCYEGQQFIGLAALVPLVKRLSDRYEVTVIFDASITRRLGPAATRDLPVLLKGAKVHVVASDHQADETLLEVSDDPFVYVLSNDRFAEFREKPAVREGRVLTHDIINGLVLVPDLDIKERLQCQC